MTLSERILDLSLCWKRAAEVFPYFDRLETDWDEAYRTYLERIPAADTPRVHFLLLAEFMALLGDGHTDVWPARWLRDETGYLPFTLIHEQGGYTLDGAKVIRLNGRNMRAVLDEVCRYTYHVGSFVPPYALNMLLPFFLNKTGNTAETEVGLRTFDLLDVPMAAAPTEGLRLREENGVLYARMDDFMHADTAEKLRPHLRGKRAVVLDIRENIGGMTAYGAKVAELFIPGKFSSCRKWTRAMEGVQLASGSQYARISPGELEHSLRTMGGTREEVENCLATWRNTACRSYTDEWGAEGQAAAFDGPVAVWTSRRTVSAAEDFAAMFRTTGRGMLVGEATAGTTGTPLLQRLSVGQVRVVSVGYRLLDGTEFIGTGIQPDTPELPKGWPDR